MGIIPRPIFIVLSSIFLGWHSTVIVEQEITGAADILNGLHSHISQVLTYFIGETCTNEDAIWSSVVIQLRCPVLVVPISFLWLLEAFPPLSPLFLRCRKPALPSGVAAFQPLAREQGRESFGGKVYLWHRYSSRLRQSDCSGLWLADMLPIAGLVAEVGNWAAIALVEERYSIRWQPADRLLLALGQCTDDFPRNFRFPAARQGIFRGYRCVLPGAYIDSAEQDIAGDRHSGT